MKPRILMIVSPPVSGTICADQRTAPLPECLTEENADNWLWIQYFDARTVTGVRADGVNAVGAVFQRDIDTKAMRKLPDEMSLYGATEVVESGAATLEVQAQTRTLMKMP